jgi:hypothetical protein
MFDKAMKKSIEPYLEPGEELLDAMIVQGKGMMKATLAGGAFGAAAIGAMRDRKSRNEAENGAEGGIEMSSKMGIAITPSRLLIFKAGGAMTLKAKELLTEVPIGDVDSVTVGKGVATKPLTITIRGESFQVEAPKVSNTDKFVGAFEQAKAGSASVA